MKFYSWNVNGIRAVAQKGFLKWMQSSKADVIGLQEIKAMREQFPEELQNPLGFHSFIFSAQKPGYSGVAFFSKKEPDRVVEGLGRPEFDNEGRVLRLDFKKISIVNAYFPNSQREHTRLGYKLDFCQAMLKYLGGLREKGQQVILCGDYNIAHRAIDLKNPKANEKNAGYLPEERAWMDDFVVGSGYIDTFRHFNKEPEQYTWWSYRPGIRERNIGWRLDYFCTNPETQDRLKAAAIHPQVLGSDHCPVSLDLRD